MEVLIIEDHEMLSTGIATLHIDKRHPASTYKDDWRLPGPETTYPTREKGEKA